MRGVGSKGDGGERHGSSEAESLRTTSVAVGWHNQAGSLHARARLPV